MDKNMMTGSFQLMKSINRSLILNIIREKGPISRAEIAKVTKLTPPTVSNLVKELLEDDIVVERNLGESSGGRKPTMLTLNSDKFFVIGLDIGSHDLKVILSSIEGKIIKKDIFPIPEILTNETLLTLMKTAIYSIKNEKIVEDGRIIGIGVGMHGIVDVEKGISVFAPNLKLQNIHIKQGLEQEFQITVKVENDARAMGLGELWFGSGTGIDSFVCINVGRGVGAGIIINGRLYHGDHFISGEIGHMAIDIDGPICTCGNKGCLQTFTSGPAIADYVKSELRLGQASILPKLAGQKIENITGELIYKAALEGDQLSINALAQAGRYLGIGLTNLIHLINPRRIILGGGVSNAKEFVLNSVIETVNQRALTKEAKQTEIIVSKFGKDATAMGAVALILTELFSAKGTETAAAH